MKRLIFVLLLICASVVSAQGTTGTTLDTINLRATPTIGDNVLAQLPIGTNVTINGRNSNGAWLFITAKGGTGWASSRYIGWEDGTLLGFPVIDATTSTTSTSSASPETTIAVDGQTTMTTKARLNVRSEPSISGTILTTLNFGQTVTAIGRNSDGSWIAIDTGAAQGWIAAAYVSSASDLNTLAVTNGLSSEPVTTTVDTTTPDTTPVVQSGSYVITGPAAGNFSSYDMEITLHWNTTANLDLRVTGPDGYLIVPGVPPSPTGGYFQQAVGANENCQTAEGAALEVITWDKGTAPSGLYHIEAQHVNSCFPENEEETLFWVSVKNDGPEVEFWVFFIEAGELFEFDFVRP